MIQVQGVLSIDNKTYFCVAPLCMAISIAIYLKVGCSPYLNKAFVYKAFVYILNFSFYSIINDQLKIQQSGFART